MKALLNKIETGLKASNVNYSLDHQGWIGIELSENNWSWFSIAKDGLLFDHTYSTYTGRSKKRLIHRLRKTAALSRVLGFDACIAQDDKKNETAPAPVKHVKGSIKAAAPANK